MESSAVAKAARTHGLPFIAVRAIVDTAEDEVPPAVSAASESGQVRIGRLFLGLLRSPADLMPLLRLAAALQGRDRLVAGGCGAARRHFSDFRWSDFRWPHSCARALEAGVRALVTGATGFVGAAVARALLREGWQVRVLARAGSDRSNVRELPVEVAVGDLTDRASLDLAAADCEGLFHVAADYRLGAPDPSELYRVNVEGTRNVLCGRPASGGEESRLHLERRDRRTFLPTARPAMSRRRSGSRR